MVVDKKLEELLGKIPENYSVTSKQLAKSLGISVRTVRSRVADLNELLCHRGAQIIARPHQGYRLQITDVGLYERFCEEFGKRSDIIPQTAQERVIFLARSLLNTDEYLKLDNLSEHLYIRRGTITLDLKKLETELARYELLLERRPNYGIRLVGSEIRKRQYIIYDLLKETPNLFDQDYKAQIQRITQCVLPELEKAGLAIPELGLEELLIRIYVSLLRIKKGFALQSEPTSEEPADINRSMELSRDIMKRVGSVFDQDISREEIAYIAFFLAGNSYLKSAAGEWDSSCNIVIPDYVQILASKMLQAVDDSYQMNLRSNLDLWMSLCQHLVPLEIRLKYGITSHNPLLKEIINHYMFAFTVASQAVVPLAKAWNVVIPHDEIGYLAVLFALALEKENRPRHQKKVLLVCGTVRSNAQLLVHKLQKEFYDDIGFIEVCDRNMLKKKDVKSFDCIFTTVPLLNEYGKPVLELKKFLDAQDIVNAKQMLRKTRDAVFGRYFRPELFWTDLEAKSWQEVISRLCERIRERRPLPDGFEESVYEREALAPTDYGNWVAMPHPFMTLSEDSFVAVGILRKPIFWKTNKVQVVFLVSIARASDDDLQDFYCGMSDFIMNEQKIKQLLIKQSFQAIEETWR